MNLAVVTSLAISLAAPALAQTTVPISAFEASSLFEDARALLPCADQAEDAILGYSLRFASEDISEDFILREFVDEGRGVSIDVSAESTPIGTVFSTSLTVTGTNVAFRDTLVENFRLRNDLPPARLMPELSSPGAAGWNEEFHNGPMVVIVKYLPDGGKTAIYATMAPIGVGSSTGC